MAEPTLDDIPESFRAFAAPLFGMANADEGLLQLLGTLGKKAPAKEARAFALLLRRTLPDTSRVRRVTDEFLREAYPNWYIRAVNDPHRNRAYRAAIEALVKPGTIVLEVGTGSGLFAMMAARAGARHVYSCEMEPEIAALARANIRRNGLEDSITVLGRYEDVEIGRDLPERAGLLIHEFVSSEFLIPEMDDMVALLRTRLLTPGAAILPAAIGAVGQLVGDRWMLDCIEVTGPVEGFDLSEINRLALPHASLRGPVPVEAPLSAPFPVIAHDLSAGEAVRPACREISVAATADGVATGVLQWVRHGFLDGSVYENRPDLACNWSPIFRPFSRSVPISAGSMLMLRVENTTTEIFLDPVIP